MKKYMFVLLILAIACAFSVSAVVAADLQEYDFDGKFTMQMEKGLNFTNSTTDDGYGYFMDISKGYVVMYIEDSQVNNNTAEQFYTSFEGEGYKNIGTDGNVTLFEKDGMYVASTYKDGIIVFSMNQDKDKALSAMKTVKFK